MKTLFIEAKYKGKVKVGKAKLPSKVGLVTTVQFVDHIDDIRKKIKCIVGHGKQKYAGQILGCDVSSASKIKDKVDAFLYVGTGMFHPIMLGLLDKEVFMLNPFSGNIRRLDKKVIEDYKKRKKGGLLKFYNSEIIGVIVSTKPGQKVSDKELLLLEKKFKDKKFYKFVTDNINKNDLEDFNFIECWVNTACPRIEEDFGCVNLKDLK